MGIVSIPGFFEPFSSMVHLLFAGLVLVGGVRLVRAGQGRARRAALTVFAVTTAALFGLSGSYHLLDAGGAGRAVLQRLDHAAIFTMIAGTFTAIHGVAFRGRWRWAFLTAVWTLAITGLTLKTIFFTSMSEWGGLVLYLGLGWMGVLSAWALWRYHGWSGVRWLLWGGVAYSAGAAYDFARAPAWIEGVVGAHEIFHVAVIAGAMLHWRCVRTLMAISRPEHHSPERVESRWAYPRWPGGGVLRTVGQHPARPIAA